MCSCMYVLMYVCVYTTFFVGIAIKTKHVLVHVKGLAKCHRGTVCVLLCYSSITYVHVDHNSQLRGNHETEDMLIDQG